jgi:hypothetical protein
LRLANALANTLARLGSIACETGEAARASELYRESLEPVRRFVFRYEAVACLEGLARVAAMQDQPEQAARLLGASAALREEMGTPLSPIAQVDHDHAVNAARGTGGRCTRGRMGRGPCNVLRGSHRPRCGRRPMTSRLQQAGWEALPSPLFASAK